MIKLLSSAVICISVFASCNNKADSPAEILAGSTSKTWHITKQTDSNGDKEKLSKKEKEENLNLYADGKFSIVGEKGTATGQWSLEGEQKFVLHFESQPVTENFSIKELKEDKITLIAGDGSEMVMETE